MASIQQRKRNRNRPWAVQWRTPEGKHAERAFASRQEHFTRERQRVANGRFKSTQDRRKAEPLITVEDAEAGTVRIPAGPPRGPAAYKQMAQELRKIRRRHGIGPASVTVDDLIVDSQSVDPFYGPTPCQTRNAEWFAALWRDLGLDVAHLRRARYRLLVSGEVTDPLGRPYTNTETAWQTINDASRWARYLHRMHGRSSTPGTSPAASTSSHGPSSRPRHCPSLGRLGGPGRRHRPARPDHACAGGPGVRL